MRNKHFIFLGLAIFIITVLCSCDNKELSEISGAQIEISKEAQEGIKNFIERVNSPTTRGDFDDQSVLRVYIGPLANCFRGRGSCLPTIIVTPGSESGISSWIQTKEAKELQELVNNNKVTMTQNYNSGTSTNFFIYTSTENNNLDLVVPVTSE